MDKKEKQILEHYKKILDERKFDEYDILGFLIFIRRHLDQEKNIKTECIKEFCNLVAHRQRDRGRVYNSIQEAIKNNYAYKKKTKKIRGYSGIKENEWKNEWKYLCQWLGIKYTEEMILEITLCIYSLAQNTEYDNCAEMTLLYINNKFSLCTKEKEKNSPYICFAQYGPYQYSNIIPEGELEKIVETYRENGKLLLRMVTI